MGLPQLESRQLARNPICSAPTSCHIPAPKASQGTWVFKDPIGKHLSRAPLLPEARAKIQKVSMAQPLSHTWCGTRIHTYPQIFSFYHNHLWIPRPALKNRVLSSLAPYPQGSIYCAVESKELPVSMVTQSIPLPLLSQWRKTRSFCRSS